MHAGALTKAQREQYEDACRVTHHRAVELEVYRLRDGKAVTSLTNRFMGGAVQGDEDRDPITYLECDLLRRRLPPGLVVR